MPKGRNNQRDHVILDEEFTKEDKLYSNKGQVNKILTIPLKLLIAIILVGVLFKLQHYPGAGIILTVGLLGFPATYSFRFAWKGKKRLKDFVKLILVVSLTFGSYFKLMHYPFADYLLTVREFALLAWLILEGIDYFYFNHWEYPGLKISGFPILAASFIVAGLLFKIQQDQYASMLLIAGFSGAAIYFGKDAFFWLINQIAQKKR